MIEMLRKINTSRAVRTMQELFPEEYDFYPRSWILPEEYQLFCAQVGGAAALMVDASSSADGGRQQQRSARKDILNPAMGSFE